MSRINAVGKNPANGEVVDVSYGWDFVPGFSPGYFFQVFSRREEDIEKDGEGILVNEGFLEGISESQLEKLKKEWDVQSAFPVSDIDDGNAEDQEEFPGFDF